MTDIPEDDSPTARALQAVMDDARRPLKKRIAELEAELAEREDDIPARITAEMERDEARQYARYAYTRWPAPIFWQASAKISPFRPLPEWLTGEPEVPDPRPLVPGLPGYACARCGSLFTSPGEPRDEHSRHAGSPWCRGCIDQCHEAGDGHQCVICAPASDGGAT